MNHEHVESRIPPNVLDETDYGHMDGRIRVLDHIFNASPTRRDDDGHRLKIQRLRRDATPHTVYQAAEIRIQRAVPAETDDIHKHCHCGTRIFQPTHSALSGPSPP